MLQTKKYLLKALLFVGLVFTLSTCKKYPENTLWFKNPKKLYPLKGHLTKYVVNGIDSLDLLNLYFGKYPKNGGLVRDIRKAEFKITEYVGNGQLHTTAFFGTSGCTLDMFTAFKRKKKYISITTNSDTSILKKNLFVDTDWKIIRLTEETGPFKIETILTNGNKYEIQFN